MAELLFKIHSKFRYSEKSRLYPFVLCFDCMTEQVDSEEFANAESEMQRLGSSLFLERGSYNDHCTMCQRKNVPLIGTSRFHSPDLIVNGKELLNLLKGRYSMPGHRDFHSATPEHIHSAILECIEIGHATIVESSILPVLRHFSKQKNGSLNPMQSAFLSLLVSNMHILQFA
jgi:hypothetical protein